MTPVAERGTARYCIEFAKAGPARFLSHLDLQEAFERALRRARLPLAFSSGFHPRPRLQFEDPLPLGWSSQCERLWVELSAPYPTTESLARLRACAPPGVRVLRVFPHPGRPAPPPGRRFLVRGRIDAGVLERVQERFAGGAGEEDTEPRVKARLRAEGLEVTLCPGREAPPPAMKKVLQALFAADVLASLSVERLDWRPERGSLRGADGRRS